MSLNVNIVSLRWFTGSGQSGVFMPAWSVLFGRTPGQAKSQTLAFGVQERAVSSTAIPIQTQPLGTSNTSAQQWNRDSMLGSFPVRLTHSFAVGSRGHGSTDAAASWVVSGAALRSVDIRADQRDTTSPTADYLHESFVASNVFRSFTH